MPKLIPAILESNFEGVWQKTQLLKQIGLDTTHLDVMDGLAVPNECWGDASLASELDIQLEVHLMVQNPLEVAIKWLKLPNVIRVILRSEEVKDYDKFFELSRSCGSLGLAIDPMTYHAKVMTIIHQLDYLLIMGVTSGFSGQEFMPRALDRLDLAHALNSAVKIGVDGGMNEKTIPLVMAKKVDVINAASYFWSGDMERKIKLIEG